MKKYYHFWSLLKCEMTSNPLIWLLGCGPFLTIYLNWRHNSFSFHSEDNTMLAFWGLFLAAFYFAPWVFSRDASWGAAAYYNDYRDFIFTRAIDRTAYFRAKSFMFLFLILGWYLLALGLTFRNPGIIVSQHSSLDSDQMISKYQERFLKNFPGSQMITRDDPDQNGSDRVHKGDIVIPHGRIMINAWMLLKMFLIVILEQAYVIGVSGHRNQKQLFWAAYIFIVGLPLVSLWLWFDLSSRTSMDSFLFFAAHWFLFSLSVLALGILLQVFSEWRFRKMEALS